MTAATLHNPSFNLHPSPGKRLSLRGRDWIVLPSDDPDLLLIKPLGGSEDEIASIYLPLGLESDHPQDAHFQPPTPQDLGPIATARLLYDSARAVLPPLLARLAEQRLRPVTLVAAHD